jgi:hypothetical protein
MIAKGFTPGKGVCCEVNEAAASATSRPKPGETAVSPRQSDLELRFHYVTPRAGDNTRIPRVASASGVPAEDRPVPRHAVPARKTSESKLQRGQNGGESLRSNRTKRWRRLVPEGLTGGRPPGAVIMKDSSLRLGRPVGGVVLAGHAAWPGTVPAQPRRSRWPHPRFLLARRSRWPHSRFPARPPQKCSSNRREVDLFRYCVLLPPRFGG